MKALFHRLAGRRYHRLFSLAGILISCVALYRLALMAMFVHQSVVVPGVVTDVRQKPYEAMLEALIHGSGAAVGDASYQPLVRFSLPSGMVINRLMTDAGSTDYTIGQPISIITPELDPSGARINECKYLWGTDTLELGVGALLVLVGFLLRGKLIRKQKKHTGETRQEQSRSRTRNASSSDRRKSTSSAPRRKKSTPAGDAPKRRTRRKKAE